MKYLKSFNEGVSSDIISDVKDIILEVQDMGYTIDINTSIQYHIEASKSLDGISITIDADPYDFFYLRGKQGNIRDCILRLNDYVKSVGYGIHIDPECKSKEFLTVEDFIDEWQYEDLTMIDIIIYNKGKKKK